MNDMLTTKQVADILGLKEVTIRMWRWRKDVNLPWIKIGRSVRYRSKDLEAFIQSCVRCGNEGENES